MTQETRDVKAALMATQQQGSLLAHGQPTLPPPVAWPNKAPMMPPKAPTPIAYVTLPPAAYVPAQSHTNMPAHITTTIYQLKQQQYSSYNQKRRVGHRKGHSRGRNGWNS